MSDAALTKALAVLPAEATTRVRPYSTGKRARTEPASQSLKVPVSVLAPISSQRPWKVTYRRDSPRRDPSRTLRYVTGAAKLARVPEIGSQSE